MPVMTVPATRCVLTSLRVLALNLSSDWRDFAELVLDPASTWTFEDFVDLEVKEAFHKGIYFPGQVVIQGRTFEEVAFMLIWLRRSIPAGVLPSSNGYVVRYTQAGSPYWSWQGCEHACAC